jgi:hypothetical protein
MSNFPSVFAINKINLQLIVPLMFGVMSAEGSLILEASDHFVNLSFEHFLVLETLGLLFLQGLCLVECVHYFVEQGSSEAADQLDAKGRTNHAFPLLCWGHRAPTHSIVKTLLTK